MSKDGASSGSGTVPASGFASVSFDRTVAILRRRLVDGLAAMAVDPSQRQCSNAAT
jgi:hypothetical protein